MQETKKKMDNTTTSTNRDKKMNNNQTGTRR